MTLVKDMLTKSLRKKRSVAIALLDKMASLGGLPPPYYEYKGGGTVKKRTHFHKVEVRVPAFVQEQMDFESYNRIQGRGRDTKKQDSKSLAALDALSTLESLLEKNKDLAQILEEHRLKHEQKEQQRQDTPITLQLEGVSWQNIPLDPNFPHSLPATRSGRIEFSPEVVQDEEAFLAAKCLTATSRESLPVVEYHANQTDHGILRFANIRSTSNDFSGINGDLGDESLDVDNRTAEHKALQHLGMKIKKQRGDNALVQVLQDTVKSFGMAKLFIQIPKHLATDMNDLLEKVGEKSKMHVEVQADKKAQSNRNSRATYPTKMTKEEDQLLQERIKTFRRHQKELPLPVDSVEQQIPWQAPVTIVKGGTGSGKTTRYPVMVSLRSLNDNTKIVVAQPRRLACQAAARRVAFEQGYEVGQSNCPVGYSIRFESLPSSSVRRTIDFMTPGVLLRKASNDPLLSDVTHLFIDEVHERNADVDLLLSLAKIVQQQRENHESLPPLRLILMSATLDSSHWESYFGEVDEVTVPRVRRFPVDIIHLGEKGFPNHLKQIRSLLNDQNRGGAWFDESLCSAIAELAVDLFRQNDLGTGSILCFLPGMEEIRLVHQQIQQKLRQNSLVTVLYLHSSVSAKDQARVFLPGPKIILSTNIAETSITIPDVKFVIDSGRERQSSLLDSTSTSPTSTVVGSQLVTQNISQAAAKQRAGRAGRVAAGTCYRLYSRSDLENKFLAFAVPEMQRMELSQLILHSLSLYNPSSDYPLRLLLSAPDPPTELQLRQTIFALSQQGLVEFRSLDDAVTSVGLTALGVAVSSLPVSPRIGRMLLMGLALRAIDPALTIAALLSVPKAFSGRFNIEGAEESSQTCSDVMLHVNAFHEWTKNEKESKRNHLRDPVFQQVKKVRRQLEQAIQSHVKSSGVDWSEWNSNSSRVAAQAGLICVGTPHIAHLVQGRSGFATRDVAGTAYIHPSSVNFDNKKRAHWYVYHELRTTSVPYLHVTTAASPLELAFFCDSSSQLEDSDPLFDWNPSIAFLFVSDQWVVVDATKGSQRDMLLRLHLFLTHSVLQQVASDPHVFSQDEHSRRLVLYVLAAVESYRLDL